MTYPPQQPGPQGQQPGDPAQGGYGQQQPQGGYPHQASYGQPGGVYPQSGPQQQPQPVFGQPNPYHQVPPINQFGQPGQFGQFDTSRETPPKKKTGLWIGIGIAAVVIAAVLITGLVAPGWMLGKASSGSASDKPASDPAALMNSFTNAFTAHDANKIIHIACALPTDADPAELQHILDKEPAGAQFTVIGSPQVTGDTATAHVKATAPGKSDRMVKVPLKHTSGKWCVDFGAIDGDDG